jgi:outer membrane protein assembly factor BamB
MILSPRLAPLLAAVTLCACGAALIPAAAAQAASATPKPAKMKEDHNWISWRGPFQNGVSAEHFKNGKLNPTPAWVHDTHGRGEPVIYDGKLFSWGYIGEGPELVEVLTCLDAKTGKTQWEHQFKDFISDIIYNRYSIGAPAVDPETKHVYVQTHYGLFMCYDFDGKEIFRVSMMEDFGRMTFPNARAGSVSIEGDLAIVHGITSNWGGDGPAADRFYAFDKLTGELVWSCIPGVVPPVDSSFSSPIFETRDGQRVLYCGTGCGHVVCVNARSGKPLFRWKACKNGINASVIQYKDMIISVHGDENVDTSDKGRMAAIKLPDKLAPAAPGADTTLLPPSAEVWRNSIGSSNGSPILVGNQIYILDDTGVISAVNADTGAIEWTQKAATANVHASLAYCDGLIYAALLNGRLVTYKPGAKGAELVQEIKLSGQCLGAPIISNGMVYVHTTDKFYAFTIENSGITWDKVPVAEIPKAGTPASLQIIPSEVLLTPGTTAKFRVRSLDKHGFVVAPVNKVSWETFIPPTAKVKSTLDAKFNDAGELVAGPDAKLSAGAFKATADGGLSGTIRGRLLQNLPIKMDFEGTQLTEEFPADANYPAYKYAYPPLPWIGARLKFQIMDHDGNMVFAKSFERTLFQRATTFIGPSHLANYTVQADVMTDGSARVKSDVGLVNQRYLIVLRGNGGQLEISSNMERLKEVAPFKMTANTWYVLKTRVDVSPDGSGVVRAKAWEKAQPEPEAWTLEAKVPIAHKNGSPGIFSFTSNNQKRTYFDNISVTSNK